MSAAKPPTVLGSESSKTSANLVPRPCSTPAAQSKKEPRTTVAQNPSAAADAHTGPFRATPEDEPPGPWSRARTIQSVYDGVFGMDDEVARLTIVQTPRDTSWFVHHPCLPHAYPVERAQNPSRARVIQPSWDTFPPVYEERDEYPT